MTSSIDPTEILDAHGVRPTSASMHTPSLPPIAVPERLPDAADVLVVGGGPGGATVATLLARAGHRVVVCEREHFPRFHIGESLLPYSVRAMQRLGVWDQLLAHGFVQKYGAQFKFEPGVGQTRLDFENNLDDDLNMALQVRRAEYDHILLANAATVGATVIQGARVERVTFDGDEADPEARATGAELTVEAPDGATSSHSIRCRMVVDATGRDTVLGKQLGLVERDPDLRQASVFSHFRGVDLALGPGGGDILVVGGEFGWFWLIPLGQGLTSVGCVFPSRVLREHRQSAGGGRGLDSLFQSLIQRSPEVQQRMAAAEPTMETLATADFSYSCRRLVGNGWMLVGDAAGFLDPVFSSGILLAIRGGEIAADRLHRLLRKGAPITGRQLQRYERVMRRVLAHFRRYILAFYDPSCLRTFASPPPAILRRAASSAFAGKVFERDPRVWLFDRALFLRAALNRRDAASGKIELPQAPAHV